MIFIEPFILASEVFQHVVLIVLVGYLIVEILVGHGKCDEVTCMPHFCPVFGDGRKEMIFLLVTVVFVGGMIIGEYFYDPITPQLQLLYHLPPIALTIYMLTFFIPILKMPLVLKQHQSLLFLYTILFILLTSELSIGIYSDFSFFSNQAIVESLLKTTEVFALYFFTMNHIVADAIVKT